MLARPFCFDKRKAKPMENPTKISRPAVQEAGAALAWALAGKMDPKPDHGAKSYRGSGRLAGHKALITGCDSGTGPRGGHRPRAREGAMSPSTTIPPKSRIPRVIAWADNAHTTTGLDRFARELE
jgi:hypothetical protein